MLRTLLISLALLAAAIVLAFSGWRGMSDGGIRFSAGVAGTPTGMSDGGIASFSDGGI